MWKKPWKLSEGVFICIGLIIIGLVLQFTIGYIKWESFAKPINIIILAVYLLALCLLYIFRKKIYFVQWAMTYTAAIPSLVFIVGITIILGVTRQVSADVAPTDFVGLSKMLSFWPFVLLYWWMATILGLVSIRYIHLFKWKKIPFICNHLGMFIAIVCGTLGSADMQRLTMNTKIGETEWRAIDKSGKIHELPLAIELKEFTIDEYPPKLMVISNATGKTLPSGKPEHLLLDENISEGNVANWNIQILDKIEFAASTATKDTVKYVEWPNVGATYAAHIRAISSNKNIIREGWVSCGSFMFPYQALKLDSLCSVVMPDREPKRFLSNVEIYTQSGKKINSNIEVNKPADVEGWKIYQLSYDEVKGAWSDVSVFELVSDPWLPWVYVGIIMMIVGAVFMFVLSNRVKEEVK